MVVHDHLVCGVTVRTCRGSQVFIHPFRTWHNSFSILQGLLSIIIINCLDYFPISLWHNRLHYAVMLDRYDFTYLYSLTCDHSNNPSIHPFIYLLLFIYLFDYYSFICSIYLFDYFFSRTTNLLSILFRQCSLRQQGTNLVLNGWISSQSFTIMDKRTLQPCRHASWFICWPLSTGLLLLYNAQENDCAKLNDLTDSLRA